MKNNDSNLLIGRKSFGATRNSKKVEILIDSENLIFQNQKWNKPFSNIQIFDTQFISENIFDTEISSDHKTKMHRIILGEKGKVLAKELSDLRTKLHEKEYGKNTDKGTRQFSREYKSSFDESLCSIENFCKIQKDNEIQNKIQKQQKYFEAVKKEKEIQLIPKLQDLNWLNLNFEEFKSILEKSFKSNHEAAEKKVLAHIQNNWKDQTHSKNFLSDGFSLLKDSTFLGKENCVFCGQDLKNATELISAYRDFFNNEYTRTKNEILGKSQKFKNWNCENNITEFLAEIEKNISHTTNWGKYLDDKISFVSLKKNIEDSKKEILDAKNNFEAEISKKEKDLNYSIDFKTFETLKIKWKEISKIVESKNIEIQNFNLKITEYLKSLSEKIL